MQLFRFDNTTWFPVLETFSHGFTDIHTTVMPCRDEIDTAKLELPNQPGTSMKVHGASHRLACAGSVSYLRIKTDGLIAGQEANVVIALPAVGISGPLKAVELLVGTCSEPCRFSLDASESGGAMFSIELGSSATGMQDAMTSAVDSRSAPRTNLSRNSEVNRPTTIQFHRLRIEVPGRSQSAHLGLLSLHVYGPVHQTSSLLAMQ